MRHNCHAKSTVDVRSRLNSPKSRGLGFIGFSLVAFCLSGPALAQDNQDSVYVDISNPNITIDLSVLDDNVNTRRIENAPRPGARKRPPSVSASAPNYVRRSVNQELPISTLYIQPSKNLRLPPQTKPLLSLQARDQATVNAAMPPVPRKVAISQPSRSPKAVVAIAHSTPPPAPNIQTPNAAHQAIQKVAPPVRAAVMAPAPKAPVTSRAPILDVAKVIPKPEAMPKPKAMTHALTPQPPAPMPLMQPVHSQIEKTAEAVAPPLAAVPTGVDVQAKTATIHPGVASLPSASGPLTDGDSMRIVFNQDSSKLPQDARNALKALSKRMQNQDGLRLQLLAYAGTADTSASAARRLSLSRALAVRSNLIENGVRSTRIDVRALGNKSSDEVTERVDITVVER